MADKKGHDSSKRVNENNFDRGITPAETAARQEREGDQFKTGASKSADGSLDTTEGYTTDKEGLTNNYAIEPEMYYEEPGDAKQQAEAEAKERSQELHEVNKDEEGKLTQEGDKRGKGTGVI